MAPAVASNHDRNHDNAVARNGVLFVIFAICLPTLRVKADVPFVIGAPYVPLSNQGRFSSERVNPIVANFGIARNPIPRGGSSGNHRPTDEEHSDGWGGDYDEDETTIPLDDSEEKTEAEDDTEEEEVGGGLADAEDYEEAEDEDEIGFIAKDDATGVVSDDEQVLLDETRSLQDYDEDNDVDLDDGDETEVDETIPSQGVGLDEHMVANVATTDDESSAFVDRMELADAYDEGETTTGGVDDASPLISPGGGDRHNEDDVDYEDPQASATVESVPVRELQSNAIDSITQEMESILRKELKYTKGDVEAMRPDIAAVVVANRVQRPTEGMPPNFYKAGVVPSSKSLRLNNVLKVTIAVAAIGVVTSAAGNSGIVDTDDFMNVLGRFPSAFAAIPAAVASIFSTNGDITSAVPSGKITESTSSAAEPIVEVESEAEEGGGGDGEQDHYSNDERAHSVKPFTHSAPEEDLDHTWLDKLITKIENAIKGFFNMKI